MQKRRIQALFSVLIALIAAIAIACGGGDSGSQDVTPGQTQADDGTPVPGSTNAPDATNQPDTTQTPDDADPIDDELRRETSREIRDVESAIRRLNSRFRILNNNIARAGGLFFGAPEEPIDDWFDECCDDSQGDISEELEEAEDAILNLIGIYEEAGDKPRLQIAQQLGTHSANINALMTVLAGLPTSEGATAIIEDMSLELVAFSEALASLG